MALRESDGLVEEIDELEGREVKGVVMKDVRLRPCRVVKASPSSRA